MISVDALQPFENLSQAESYQLQNHLCIYIFVYTPAHNLYTMQAIPQETSVIICKNIPSAATSRYLQLYMYVCIWALPIAHFSCLEKAPLGIFSIHIMHEMAPELFVRLLILV